MDFKLTILGVGTFFVNDQRSASAYLLEIDGKKILIDCGPGTLMRLSQAGFKPQDLDYIFITHFHADHTSDLFPLFMNFRLLDFSPNNKPTKFPEIIGPKGIYKFLLRYSKNCELPALSTWGKIKFFDLQKTMSFGKITIKSFKVKHNAFGINAKSYALRFEFDNKVISFSGDTINCVGVERACKGADIFVCDASYPKGQKNQAHMDTNDVGEICQKNKVKKVILSHLYPQTDMVDMVSEVREKFSGVVVRGKDLMVI